MTEESDAPVSHRRSWVFRRRGLIGGLLLGPLALLALVSRPMLPASPGVALLVDAIAWPLFATGVGFRLWATLYIGGRKHKQVVGEGPYSLCRNPLYFGSLCLALSAGLFLKCLVLGGALVAVVAADVLAAIPAEEAFLAAALGEEYARYRDRVPRLWPAPGGYLASEWVEVKVETLRAECLRMLRWIWLPLAGEAFAYLRTLPEWPHWLALP